MFEQFGSTKLREISHHASDLASCEDGKVSHRQDYVLRLVNSQSPQSQKFGSFCGDSVVAHRTELQRTTGVKSFPISAGLACSVNLQVPTVLQVVEHRIRNQSLDFCNKRCFPNPLWVDQVELRLFGHVVFGTSA